MSKRLNTKGMRQAHQSIIGPLEIEVDANWQSVKARSDDALDAISGNTAPTDDISEADVTLTSVEVQQFCPCSLYNRQ
jgi:hypothetical protein